MWSNRTQGVTGEASSEMVFSQSRTSLRPRRKKSLGASRHPRTPHTICETGNHLVVCAPTAGGKTEAAFLPIISQLAARPQPSVQALYVGPLKALINDQFRRLEQLCEKLEMPVHRWHGDVPANQKKALRDHPKGILLITPESLESNFINFGAQVARVYRHL